MSFGKASLLTVTTDADFLQSIWEFFPFVYRINDNYVPGQSAFTILEMVCKERGWKEYGADNGKYSGVNILGWNLWWRTAVMLHAQNRSLYSWQYTNHIPKAVNFCNKEYLASYTHIMKGYFGEIYNFCPETFTLPKQMKEFEEEHQRRSSLSFQGDTTSVLKNLVPTSQHPLAMDSNGNRTATNHEYLKPVWICKPVGKSQGKGISLIDNPTNLPDHPVTIVQEYIARPYLISGHKFDLRLYVCIVSVSPLTVYVYHEGLTRFATEPYNLEDLEKIYSHLTNSSINKLSPGYEIDKIGIGMGCKWTLQKLRRHLQQENETDWFMWQRVMSIIVLTILGEVGQHVSMPSSRNNFEFLGYDILVDTSLRPWLLETNLSPGLGGDCDVDLVVKKPMLHELFDLVGLPDSRPFWSGVSIRPSSSEQSSIIALNTNSNMEMKRLTEVPQLPLPASECTMAALEAENARSLDCEQKHPTFFESSKFIRNVGKREKVSIGLRNRLLDVSAIYSQKLHVPPEKRRQNKDKKTPAALIAEELSQGESARLSLLAHRAVVKDLDGTASTIPRRPGIGLKKRSWHEAPGRHGGWVRIFPFDYLSFQMTRGHTEMNMKAIVENMEKFLQVAEELVEDAPGLSDEYYTDKLKEHISWNRILWYPPK